MDGDAEFVVFGVVTEYCVALAAKGLLERGRRVSVVEDAIETLKPQDGQRTISELQALGAKLISTDQALALLNGAKSSIILSSTIVRCVSGKTHVWSKGDTCG